MVVRKKIIVFVVVAIVALLAVVGVNWFIINPKAEIARHHAQPISVLTQGDDGIVLDSTSDQTALIDVSRNYFASAQVAVISSPAKAAHALDVVKTYRIPLFVVDDDDDFSKVIAELKRLGVHSVIFTDDVAGLGWNGETIEKVSELDEFAKAEGMLDLALLTDQESLAGEELAALGADVVVHDGDPRASRDIIAALAQATATAALVEHPTEELAWQIATARAGTELPGGGQLVFNGKRYVALYGAPMNSALGVLGEQGVAETIDRARQTAVQYDNLTEDTVIPALEIIVTVASAEAGEDGNYSKEFSVDNFLPLIKAAQDAGQYVILDFQPGRTDFLTQVRQYEELLKYPNVGVALDPEWRLGPNEVHLRKIGHVEVAEVNQVVTYLADFVQKNNLPQKALVLHQFQVQMLRGIDQLDQSRSEIALLIHVDGQGGQSAKAGTWRTLVNNAPDVKRWGWKNFYDEDTPMLTPEETYQIQPLPDFVSYQ